jgi:5-methylthioadenosine/S-adenosylhomocysteine deaminase
MDGLGPETRLERAGRLFENGHEFVGTMPHGTYTVGPDSLRAAIKLSTDYGGFFCTHVAETAAEQTTVIERYGKRIVHHLDDFNALGPRSVFAHCVHVDGGEIARLAETGCHVVLNPMSNLKLASGFAPVPEMLNAGINLTLGTDGPISGNDMDMFLAMRLTATLHKAVKKDAATVSASQVLHMATLNAAKALGAQDRLGSIETGKDADFIIVDVSQPHAVPMFNPISHLVYSASKGDVSDVFVGGRQIMADRNLLTLDVKDLVARARALQPAIAASQTASAEEA